jgi:hypothetical protein
MLNAIHLYMAERSDTSTQYQVSSIQYLHEQIRFYKQSKQVDNGIF